MILELIAEGLTREEILALYEESGTPRIVAEFIYGIETGEVPGDDLIVDEEGNVLPGGNNEMLLGGSPE